MNSNIGYNETVERTVRYEYFITLKKENEHA